MNINIENLIGKVEIHYHSNEPQEALGLENAISKIISNAVAGISQVSSEDILHEMKEKDKTRIEPDAKITTQEFNKLKYHEAITIGLWVIDRNPQEVSYEWIKENAYQIKPTSIYPECKS